MISRQPPCPPNQPESPERAGYLLELIAGGVGYETTGPALVIRFLPFLILMIDEELVELLPLKLQLVVRILFDGLVVSDGIILGGQISLEGHHGRLNAIILVLALGYSPASSSTPIATTAATPIASVAAVIIIMAPIMPIPSAIIPENQPKTKMYLRVLWKFGNNSGLEEK